MTPLKAFIAAVVGTTFAAAPFSGADVELAEERTTRPRGWEEAAGLPDDPGLPALEAIQATGLTGAIPVLDLNGHPVELALLGYTPGRRATIEVRAGNRRYVIKAYAEDPALEAELYESFAASEVVRDSAIHVPQLLSYDATLRALAIGWLEGQTLGRLIKNEQGIRAGKLAAQWVRCSAALPLQFGPPIDAAPLVRKVFKWTATLGNADHGLAVTAAAVARRLECTVPKFDQRHLVHGSLYDRHLFDMGDGPGLIDWDCFGQGPLELDAGVFLASARRTGLRHERLTAVASQTVDTFLAETAGLLNPRTLAWYWSVSLLRFAHKKWTRWAGLPSDSDERPDALLREALRVVEATG